MVRQFHFTPRLPGISGVRTARAAAMAALAAPAFTGVAAAGTFTCTWTDTGANWTTAADWSNCNSTFPNSTTTNTYNAVIPTGDPLLNSSVTVGTALLETGGGIALSGGTLKGTTLTLTDGTDTVSGNGIVGSGGLAIVNGGTIDASTGTLTLNGTGGITNANGGTGGLLEATGSETLSILNTVNNVSGNITANGAGSTVSLDSGAAVTGGTITANGGTVIFGNATVTGSTLTNTGGGVMRTVAGKTPTLSGVTISPGSTYTQTDGTTSDLTGTITNNGTIALNGGGGKSAVLLLTGNTSLTGGGTVQMTDSTGSGNAFFEGNGFTLTNVNTISGTGTIGNGTLGLINTGTIEAATAGGTEMLALNGTGGVANNGTFEASNGATLGIVPSFTNTGTIHALNGGTVIASSGFTGTTGTAQIDAGGTLDIRASSTIGTLIQNGTLGLGSNNITVSGDYVPLNFGTSNSGNSFDRNAGVTLNVTNPGDINAAGPNANTLQATTGADVSGGATATPTLNLGNVRVGSTTSATYAIENTGTASNPSIRGAIQTSVDGGNITFPGLSGSGATAQNFGPIAPGSSSDNYTVTYAPTTAGALSGQALQFATNFGNVDPQTMTITGSVYRLANPVINTPSPVSFAARVGDTVTPQTLSITNSSPDAYTEDLAASFGTTATPFTGSGSIADLAAQETDASSLSIGLDTSTAGSFSGMIPLDFTSTGTFGGGAGSDGGDPVAVDTDASVSASANIYTPAVAAVPSSVNFGIVHVGDGGGSLTQSAAVQNGAAVTALNDVLTGSINGGSGPFSTNGNLGGGLGPQVSSSALKVMLNTGTAGIFSSTANFSLASHDPQLADLPLATNPLDLQAQVNNYAALAFVKQGGAGTLTGADSAYTLDFGTVRGDSSPEAILAFLNDNPISEQLFTDLLSSNGTITSGAGFAIAGNSVGDLPGGGMQSGFDVTMETSQSGIVDEVLTFDVESSNSSGYDQVISDVSLTLEGDVLPEPGSIALLGSGLGMLAFALRRARRRR